MVVYSRLVSNKVMIVIRLVLLVLAITSGRLFRSSCGAISRRRARWWVLYPVSISIL